MHMGRIEFERWPGESRPEPRWRFPGFAPVAFLVLLLAKLAWIMATAPMPTPDMAAQFYAEWSLQGP